MPDPFVVVGGDAAGLSAASKFAREAPARDVIVFEEGRWVSSAYCGMPYYVKGEVDRLTDLLSLTPAAIEERGIDLRRGHEVVGVSPDDQTVTVDSNSGTFEQPYSELLIATGARALTIPFDGVSLERVFTLHDMDSAAAIRAYLQPPGEFDPGDVGWEYVDRDLVERYAAMTPPETVALVGRRRPNRNRPFRHLLVAVAAIDGVSTTPSRSESTRPFGESDAAAMPPSTCRTSTTPRR